MAEAWQRAYTCGQPHSTEPMPDTDQPPQTQRAPALAHRLRLAAAAVTIAAGLAAAGEPSPADLERVDAAISAAREEIEAKESSRAALERELRAAETRIGDLLREIREIERRISEADARLTQLVPRRSELEARRAAEQEAFGEILRSAYRTGSQSRLKLLLNQENPQDVVRLLRYHEYLSRDTRARLERYAGMVSEIDELGRVIDAELGALEASRRELQGAHDALAAAQASRRETIAALDSDIKDENARLRQLENDREALDAMLRRMHSELVGIELEATKTPFQATRGALPWPAEGGLRHRFGARRSQGALRWQGVVIAAAPGSPVHAVHDGRVVYADWLRGAGLLVVVDHGDGFMTLYAHILELTRSTGEWIQAGDEIARSGSTGGQAEPGLYFEIRRNGKPQDPALWCRRRS